MTERFDYHYQLFQSLDALLSAFLEQDPDHDPQGRQEIAEMLAELRQALDDRSDYLEQGQQLLCRLVSHFPALTPHISRDLLWFFGGDCLHFLADEELAQFQLLEERYHEAQEQSGNADYADLRAQVLGLH